jgi:hypothetical protein
MRRFYLATAAPKGTEMLDRPGSAQAVDFGSCGGPQPLAGKQVIGVQIPGHGLKPAFGSGHVFASRSTLFFIDKFSRSVIAQRVRGRYSRLVQNDRGEPGLAARHFMADERGLVK